MHFLFTDDQIMVRDAVRQVMQQQCPPDLVRGVWEGEQGGVASAWSALAEIGVIGMAASEAAGGACMGVLDTVLPMEEMAYAALPAPIIDTVAMGIPLLEALGTDAQKDRWLGRAVSGDAKIVVGLQDEPFVAYIGMADVVILQRQGVGYCVPVKDLATESELSVDRTRDLSRVIAYPGEATQMRVDVDVNAVFDEAAERGTIATAAQLIGLCRRMLDMTVQYAKDRVQFGRPIGAQQAVKHCLADALIQQEFARPLVYRAACSWDQGELDARVAVSLAKVYAGEAAQSVVKKALQVHGAIGYTIEYDLHMWMKRVWALARMHGDAAYHRGRVAEHIL